MSGFYAFPDNIVIPLYILQDKQLTIAEKAILSYFWNRLFPEKAIGLNIYFLSKLFKVGESYMQNKINKLENLGYVKIIHVLDEQLIEVCNNAII